MGSISIHLLLSFIGRIPLKTQNGRPIMTVGKRLKVDDAEEIAISALSFLGGEPAALGRFLSLTGVGPADLRLVAREPGFLAGVLEFFMADESLLLAFAEAASIRPTMIAAARYALVGDRDA
jgi:hypothetical protein